MLIGRSVLAEVGRNFAASLLATTGMAFFMLAITFLKRTPGVGLGFLVEVFPLFFPLALQFTVPLAVLTAVVLTFGRMQGDGELTALAAAGVPPWVPYRPVLAAAAVIALAGLLLSDVSAPFAATRLRAAKRNLPRQLQTSFKSGLRELDFGQGRISFESFDGDAFQDVCLEWKDELWRAQSGVIAVTPDDRVVIELFNARAVMPAAREDREAFVAVKSFALDHPLDVLTRAGDRQRKRADLVSWELAYVGGRGVDRSWSARVRADTALEELARRSALAASAFFFALIGIPLGVFSARGGRVGAFLVAIAPVLLVFFPILIAGSNQARKGAWPAWPALWAANVVLGIGALLLLRRQARR